MKSSRSKIWTSRLLRVVVPSLLFQDTITQSRQIAGDSMTSVVLCPTRCDKLAIVVCGRICTFDGIESCSFIDGLQGVIILRPPSAIASTTADLVMPYQATIAPVVAAIGETPTIDDKAQNLDSSMDTDTRKPLESTQDRRMLDPRRKSLLILALLLAIELNARLELLANQGAGPTSENSSAVASLELILSNHAGTHNIFIRTDKQTKFIQSTGAVIDFPQ